MFSNMLSVEKRFFAKIARLNIKKKKETNIKKIKEINEEIKNIKEQINNINTKTKN